ncbi:MAG: hypothetical protein UY01_C0007G0026 [Candidatus Nomurabacteria bacterium GW2011_GWB1_47_6]|uniref:TrbC/VIRB2 family protein n=1 Tax=Candidatus Nomurabacteria bacterium GW2011_GWB1_47_6 TaxID=1618749 RepID=A0A0G1VBZ1_9BACT|nr:MAG: hypothetical protein UY01_C0007G0026 [Candidatus Nomurabacteria bacterium GW2011_GWB1_47_6]
MMSYIKTNLPRLIVIFYMVFLPLISFADCDPAGGTICNPIPKVGTLPDLIRIILEGILKIGIPIVALAVIYAGFLFVAARGNPEKLETAKQTLLYTLIGAAILLGSWAIAQMISSTIDALK